MSRLDKVLQYRKQLDQAHRQVAVAEGKLESAKETLSVDFGCHIEEAKNALERLDSKLRRLNQKASKKLKSFEDKWEEQLES